MEACLTEPSQLPANPADTVVLERPPYCEVQQRWVRPLSGRQRAGPLQPKSRKAEFETHGLRIIKLSNTRTIRSRSPWLTVRAPAWQRDGLTSADQVGWGRDRCQQPATGMSVATCGPQCPRAAGRGDQKGMTASMIRNKPVVEQIRVRKGRSQEAVDGTTNVNFANRAQRSYGVRPQSPLAPVAREACRQFHRPVPWSKLSPGKSKQRSTQLVHGNS